MSARTKKITVENCDIHTTELEFCDATDLWADLLAALGGAGGAYAEGAVNGGEALGRIAKEVAAGGLVRFLARVLARTTVIFKGDAKVELLDSREKLNQAFTGRQKFAFHAVKLALEVNFKDFLDGLESIGLKIPRPSLSAVSPPSTAATG